MSGLGSVGFYAVGASRSRVTSWVQGVRSPKATQLFRYPGARYLDVFDLHPGRAQPGTNAAGFEYRVVIDTNRRLLECVE